MSDSSGFDFSSVIDDAKKIILSPADFFAGMAKQGGYVEPMIFVTVMGLLAGLVTAVVSLLGGGFMMGMTGGFLSIIIIPVFAVIGSFIGAVIMFVIWKLMGSTESYETAYRCVAYSSAIYPVSAIAGLVPYLGTAVSVVWGIWLMIVASTTVHNIEAKKAQIVLGILGAIALLLNLSGERTSRQMEKMMGEIGSNMQGSLENMENMTPEEAGEALGKFMKGLEKAAGENTQ